MDLSSRIAVRSSYERAKQGGDVLGRFYELFLDSDPQVREKFAETDLERQKQMLNGSLEIAMFAAVGDRYARSELDRVQKSHGPSQLNIPGRLFDVWRECLIRAMGEFDPEFDAELERQWSLVLQPAIDYLLRDQSEPAD